MKKTSAFLKAVICLFTVSVAFSFMVFAAEVSGEMQSGIYQFRQENYDEALDIFKKIRKAEPDNALCAYYLGLTYKRIENFVAAGTHLRAAIELDPGITGALLELVDVLYRLNEVKEAKEWIKKAEEKGVRPAQTSFLKGLTLVKAGDYDGALEAFRQAKDLDKQLTQAADYQMGIVYLRQKRYKVAKKAFMEVSELDPQTDVGGYANNYLEAIDRKIEREKPFNMTLETAFEYDSNVALRPTNASLVPAMTDRADTRQIYDFEADYTLRSPNNFLSLKSGYDIRISKQNDLGAYDVVGNTFSLQPRVNFDRVLVSFPASFDHLVVNDKNYLASLTVGNINSFMVMDNSILEGGLVYKYKEYLRPPFVQNDRSGNEIIGTCGFLWFFDENRGVVHVRYAMNKDWARGSNWEYLGNRISGGVRLPFWKKLVWNVTGDIFFKGYNNSHSAYQEERSDQVYAVSSLLTYEVVKNTEFEFQYTFISNRSNLGLYDYSRYIISTGVRYKF